MGQFAGFWGRNYPQVSILQEYPTEPLDKIPALQGRIALAGKLNIGHMHLLENLYKRHAGWELCWNTGLAR